MSYIEELEDIAEVCGMITESSDTDSLERRKKYVRNAVDNLRRVSEQDQRSKVEVGSLSYDLACYVNAIEYLAVYDDKDMNIGDESEMILIIRETTKLINRGVTPELFDHLYEDNRIEAALDTFARELRERINNARDFHPMETLALIEYRLTCVGRLFVGFSQRPDRRVVEALCTLYLLRGKMRLPDYSGIGDYSGEHVDANGRRDEVPAAIRGIERDISVLRRSPKFRERVERLRGLFRRPKVSETKTYAVPKDPWRIVDNFSSGHNTTVYDSTYVTRSPEQIDQLRRATGEQPERLAVFLPERMALHETIAAAVTKVKMVDPQKFIQSKIVAPDQFFDKVVLPTLVGSGIIGEFKHFLSVIYKYVSYLIDDHFFIVNPNEEVRSLISFHKDAIESRIRGKLYEPRLVESRDALQHLVIDDLIRGYFKPKVRQIVDNCFEEYFLSDPRSRLDLRSNENRITFLTVGGPASGKSGLKRLINLQYKELIGTDDPLCQIDSDHYKIALLDEKSMENHGRTWSESNLIRHLAEERLECMIRLDKLAPDFWISTTIPQSDRLKLVSGGISRSIMYVVTCAVEGSSGAVMRAYNRALRAGEDFGRFIPTGDLLHRHKMSSKLLPKSLDDVKVLRMFSTTSVDDEPTLKLFAKMDGHNKGLRVLDPKEFLEFIKKSLIRPKADSQASVYASRIMPHRIASRLWAYAVNDITITFRYNVTDLPNPIVNKYHCSLSEDYDQVSVRAFIDSQHEAYFWAGHERIEISDIKTCLEAIGEDLLRAILLRFGRKWSVKVRDYVGNLVLDLDFSKRAPMVNSNGLNGATKVAVESMGEVLTNEYNKLSRLGLLR